ncbi:MAG: sulfatase [Bryobacter sp.]|jgi:arylsulfatase A-like enzyme|nr:sulfatase [Bryobacter sp. CoA8 C33]
MFSRRECFAGIPYVFARAAAKPKRNVLFIAIDDLNDWVGCLGGYPGVQTPNLDQLASQGVLFRSAHCAAPLCNPARTAILTGRLPAATGVYNNNQPYSRAVPLDGVITLNQHFKQSGYVTLGSGKIYHGTYGKFADRKGWDDYRVTKDRARFTTPGPQAGQASQGSFDFGPTAGGDEEMLDYETAGWVAGHLSRKQPAPLFLACGITKPHLAWHVPKKYFDLYPIDNISLPIVKADDLNDIPPAGVRMAKQNRDHERITDAGAWRRAVQAYLASISFADAMVGRLLRALETGPHAGNTTVMLWSDHGWHLGEKLHWRKFTLWERSTRNVLMIRSPGVTRPGGTCDSAVSMINLYPTLVELEGLGPAGQQDGVSMMHLLANPRAKWQRPVLTTYGRGNHAVRTGDLRQGWRYIRYRDGDEELYDRSTDPNEWTNLAAKRESQARLELMRRLLPAVDAPDAPQAESDSTDV